MHLLSLSLTQQHLPNIFYSNDIPIEGGLLKDVKYNVAISEAFSKCRNASIATYVVLGIRGTETNYLLTLE